MRRQQLTIGALVGLAITAPLAAIMYLGGQVAGLPIAHGVIFSLVRDHLPGGLLTFGIETMDKLFTGLGMRVDTAAKSTEMLMAVGLFLILGAIAGLIY